LKIQWVSQKGISSNGTVIEFPILFSNLNYSLTSGLGRNTTNGNLFFSDFTTSSVIAKTLNNYGNTISIIIIGY
jgi:hypothetical protein